MKNYDIIVIGAGAAGIACAHELISLGYNVLVIEARNRIGGRIYTVNDPSLDVPLELGAEFIHGAPPSILSRARNRSIIDVSDNHIYFKNGQRENVDFWEKLEKSWKKLKQTKNDQPVSSFLESVHGEAKDICRSYVEGFHAADPAKMSKNALAISERAEEPNLNGRELFRPALGYRHFLNQFEYFENADLELNTQVTQIRWDTRSVTIQTHKKEMLNAKAVVVTIPLGPLKANANLFSPNLSIHFAALEMGHIQKLVFIFKSRFWENIWEEPVTFLHTTSNFLFPTWWTMIPVRSPILVGWQGGPKAQEISTWSEGDRVDAALKTLSSITKWSLSKLKKELVSCHLHDWSNDPLNLGAYSYRGLGKFDENNFVFGPIYFAGEAWAQEPARGTVHGAIDTGLRAAHAIARKLKLNHPIHHGNRRDDSSTSRFLNRVVVSKQD